MVKAQRGSRDKRGREVHLVPPQWAHVVSRESQGSEEYRGSWAQMEPRETEESQA